MALSIFADALPFTEVQQNYVNWFDHMQMAELVPNIAYSSSLHWQLYCNKYPDDRGCLVDWCQCREKNKSIRLLSYLLRPTDSLGLFGVVTRKLLDRYIFRRNAFANIPFKFRGDFSERGKYLFWDKNEYGKEDVFNGYSVVSQDEGHISFSQTIELFFYIMQNNNPNIFLNTGFADALGHKCRRGELYSSRLRPYMQQIHSAIETYLNKYPDEEVLIVSDHGMSTIKNRVDLHLEEKFGLQSKRTYIAYVDSCIMCVWVYDNSIRESIKDYLSNIREGHLLSEEERCQYRASLPVFGDFIFILREGNCFENNWFGKSLRSRSADGEGMHGFWPEREARDQMATVLLINGKRTISPVYTYPAAYKLIYDVMQGSNHSL